MNNNNHNTYQNPYSSGPYPQMYPGNGGGSQIPPPNAVVNGAGTPVKVIMLTVTARVRQLTELSFTSVFFFTFCQTVCKHFVLILLTWMNVQSEQMLRVTDI